ncbi:MAG: 50S ribosomal protein L6 [bacterium]
MSRIGEMPIKIPDGIDFTIKDNTVVVKNEKGVLKEKIHSGIKIKVKENTVYITRPNDSKYFRSLHGLYRSLIYNMIFGLKEGYEKHLEIHGIGYDIKLSGKTVIFNLGYSHPIYFIPPDNITIETPEQNKIVVKGFDKALVGEVAAKIRAFRPPEPYKGKGIRFIDEHVRKKAGKAAITA